MDKKWSCPACEYKSGRWSNVSRHIGRKHGNYEVPVLTEFQNTGLSHQASRDYSYHYFPHPRQDFNKDILEKKKADSFISSYKFEDKKLGINDLLLQMERAVSSSSYRPLARPVEGNYFNENIPIIKRFGSDLATRNWQTAGE